MSKLLTCEGYKMFEGEMVITPPNRPEYILSGVWLYKPDCDCWYCKGSSFPSKVCTPKCDEQ